MNNCYLFCVVDEVWQDVCDVLGVVQQIGKQDVEIGRQVLHVHAELPEADVGLKILKINYSIRNLNTLCHFF